MKYIYIVLLVSLFAGCGYKADPIYVNDTKQNIKINNKK